MPPYQRETLSERPIRQPLSSKQQGTLIHTSSSGLCNNNAAGTFTIAWVCQGLLSHYKSKFSDQRAGFTGSPGPQNSKNRDPKLNLLKHQTEDCIGSLFYKHPPPVFIKRGRLYSKKRGSQIEHF